jgi:hypothetical protein
MEAFKTERGKANKRNRNKKKEKKNSRVFGNILENKDKKLQ